MSDDYSYYWVRTSEEHPEKSICVMGAWVNPEGYGTSFHHVWYFIEGDKSREALPHDEGWMTTPSQTGHHRKPDYWIPLSALPEVPEQIIKNTEGDH